MTDSENYVGQQGVADVNSKFNSRKFMARQQIGHVRTGMPVKIVAVYGGGVGPPPTVDVQPLVNQVDAVMKSTQHGIIYGIQTTRTHGGTSAIINDPVVGDIGYMVIADRDISSLKANNGEMSNPGSFRRHDLSDGVYMGKLLDPTAPTNYIQHVPGGGFNITDQFGNTILMDSSGITITTQKLRVVGPLEVTGEVRGKSDDVNIHLTTHLHGGPPPPDPGT